MCLTKIMSYIELCKAEEALEIFDGTEYDLTGESFIENRGKGCLLNSYWKVYHNPKRAKSIFASYDRARGKVISSMNC